MTEYYDRYGVPLHPGDAVAALRGDEGLGYRAMIYIIAIPEGHHTPMLCSLQPFGNVYQYIPADTAKLRLTNLGPHRAIDRKTFVAWRYEVSQLPNVESETLMNLRFRIKHT